MQSIKAKANEVTILEKPYAIKILSRRSLTVFMKNTNLLLISSTVGIYQYPLMSYMISWSTWALLVPLTIIGPYFSQHNQSTTSHNYSGNNGNELNGILQFKTQSTTCNTNSAYQSPNMFSTKTPFSWTFLMMLSPRTHYPQVPLLPVGSFTATAEPFSLENTHVHPLATNHDFAGYHIWLAIGQWCIAPCLHLTWAISLQTLMLGEKTSWLAMARVS